MYRTYHLILIALLAASASLRHLCLLSRLCVGFPFIQFSLIYYVSFQPLISWQWMLCFCSFLTNREAEDAGTTLIPLSLHCISRYHAIVDISFNSLVSPSESLWSSDKIKIQLYKDSHKEYTVNICPSYDPLGVTKHSRNCYLSRRSQREKEDEVGWGVKKLTNCFF